MQDALWTYKQLNGDCLVPFKFVVPESPEYPEHTHDLKLGNTLSNIRCKGVYAAYRDRVIALGVSFEKNELYEGSDERGFLTVGNGGIIHVFGWSDFPKILPTSSSYQSSTQGTNIRGGKA